MDVKKLLIDTLGKYGFPIFLQGTMSSDAEYPDHFFTFFNNNTYSESFFDNQETRYLWDFDLNFYSSESEKVNNVLIEAVQSLRKAGFFASGKGYDVLSETETHTGRGINIYFLEKRSD